MSFIEHGFLSPDIDRVGGEARGNMGQLYALALDVNALAMRTVKELSYTPSRQHLAIGGLLYIRAVRGYQAALTLAWRGMCVEASGLCRTVIECAIHLAKLHQDPGHAAALRRAQERHEIKQAKAMLSFASQLDPGVRTLMEATAAKPLPPESDYKYEVLAKEVGLEVMYQALYRATSGSAAHATVGALQTHLTRGDEGLEMVFSPQWEMLDHTLALATTVGLEATSRVGYLLELEAVERECVALVLRVAALRASPESS